MLVIKLGDTLARFDEMENEWECNDKNVLEILERHWKDMFEDMPYDAPFTTRGVGGYIVDNLSKIYGEHVVEVLLNKPSFIPTYGKDGNIKIAGSA